MSAGPWLWVSTDDGGTVTDMVSPDAMERLLDVDRKCLVGRTASAVVIRQPDGTEVTFHRMPEADYV